MADQLQLRGGTTTEHNTFTGASKEVTVDTTKKTAVVHDGSTAGGNPLMREDGANSALALGSAGTPSLKFTGSNTGIYSPGADQVAVATNGEGRLFISDTGEIIVNDSGSITSSVNGPVKIRGVVAAGTVALSLINAQPSDAGATVSIEAGQQTRRGGRIVFGRENAGNWATTSLADGYISFESVKNNINSEALRITSDGLVGIGTSAPAGTLHVNSSTLNTPLLKLDYSGSSNSSGNILIPINVAQNTEAGSALTATTLKITDTSTGGPFPLTKTLTGLHVDVSASTYGIKNAAIFEGGKVGIGTTSPGSIFQVRVAANQNIAFNQLSGESRITCYNDVISAAAPLGINGSDLRFQTNDGERARIDSSGRLLVGTPTAEGNPVIQAVGVEPASFCRASTGGGPIVSFKRTHGNLPTVYTAVTNGDSLGVLNWLGADGSAYVNGASIQANVDGNPGANDMPGRLVFSTRASGASSPTERMRITSGGGVCIGTPQSAGLLTIVQPTATHAQSVNVSTSTSGSLSNCAAVLVNTHGFYSTNYNHVGIKFVNADNTAGRSNRELDFINYAGTRVGSVTTTTTATAYNTSSDYRLKENISPVANAVARLQEVKPCRFNFIDSPDTVVDGFLAHEVQTIVPEAVTGEKDAVDDEGNPVYQGIDQSKLVPLLTAALQEAIGRIETLEAEVAALKGA